MEWTKQSIELLVNDLLNDLQGSDERAWLCDDVNEGVARAKDSQKQLLNMTLSKRAEIIQRMRQAAKENSARLAVLAHEETGYGNVADKIRKNNLAIEKTPGIEDLQTDARTGDDGLTLTELAPFGVIGSITPSTNPTSTIINNSISMIAAGNSILFNPHPGAKKASQETMRILNEAIVAAGGPSALIVSPRTPSLETSKAIMQHREVKLLSITGGEAVVAVAMKMGKKVIAAGPGNPPVIVDNTANIKQAARDIVDGASFDNNVLCIAEKELFAFDNIFDELLLEMEGSGAFRLLEKDLDRLAKTVLIKEKDRFVPNKNYVGRDASKILQESGIPFSGEPRLIVAELSKDHPFVHTEMLMPVLAMVRVRNIEEAIEEAVCAEQGYLHSAHMHSSNVHFMSMAAKALNTTLFVKNAPSYAGLGFGGEGHASLTIATPTGEGITSARSFTRARRCVLKGDFHIV